MNTFKNSQYTITTSLNDETGMLYIEFANNISYASYEGSFNSSEFRLSFGLNEIYILINNTFAEFVKNEDTKGSREDPTKRDKYQLTPVIDNGMMVLNYHCIVSGFLNVEFSLRLRKKKVSGDEQLLVELNKQKQLVDTLMKRIKQIEMHSTKQTDTIEKNQDMISSLTKQIKDAESAVVEKQNKIVKLDKLIKDFSIIDNFTGINLFSPQETQENIDLCPGEIRNEIRKSIQKYGWNIRRGNINKKEMNGPHWETTLYTDTKLVIRLRQSGQGSAHFFLDGETFYAESITYFSGPMDPSRRSLFEKWGQEGKLSKKYIHPQVYVDYLVGCKESEIMKAFSFNIRK
jgi:hypothetical protein